MNLILPAALGLALHVLAPQGTPARQDQKGARVLKSDDPFYELTLPDGYDPLEPSETPPRYLRSAGREPWARVSVQVTAMGRMLPQNPAGITAEEILPLVSLPPNSNWTFSRTKWKDLEVGVIEYRAVVSNLPVVGLSTILPLVQKGLRITVYAPDPLEKEVREDFQQLVSTISKTESNWYTNQALRQIATMEKVTMVGAALIALYPMAWLIFFRGRPLAAHWLRTGWLLMIALLLFSPITSPGPTSIANNLVVNALVPLMFIMLTIRRLKLGIDVD